RVLKKVGVGAIKMAVSLLYCDTPESFTNQLNSDCMGLFSFLKGSGDNLLKKKEETKAAAASATALSEARKASLLAAVNKLNLPVTDLSLDVNDDTVTVYGQAETQMAKELVVLTLGNNQGIASVDDRISVVKPEPEADFYEVKS